jgi:glucosamine--fructose-6-phosphate aminotransferase (isomerizing)
MKADVLLPICAGEEYSVSTKTYVNSLAALAVLARALAGGDPGPRVDELRVLPDLMQAFLAGWQAHVAGAKDALAGARTMILAGRGTSLAAAGTGGLIIKESAHFPAEGMSSAAFRHGPLEMASAELFVLVFAGSGSATGLNRRLVEDIRAAGGASALVEASGGKGTFDLPRVPLDGLPLMEILPAQMCSLALAELRGLEAGKFSHASKVTETE